MGTNHKKCLKRGTFLNFLCISTYRVLQKEEHMITSLHFWHRKEEQLASMFLLSFFVSTEMYNKKIILELLAKCTFNDLHIQIQVLHKVPH